MTYIIDGYLYLGSRFDSENYEMIRGKGITAIINVTPNEPNYFSDNPEFNYLRCPIEDNVNAEIELYFDVCADFIEEMRNDGRTTLVHCRGGISRSPSIVIAYLIKYRKFSLSDAYKLVSRNRRISPNSEFMKKLENYSL
jgi:protein-tyrosine phosphatase